MDTNDESTSPRQVALTEGLGVTLWWCPTCKRETPSLPEPAEGRCAMCSEHQMTHKPTDEDELFADYPPLTPGRITYGTLVAIVKWRERHGIGGDVTEDTVLAYREEGQTAGRAGLEMGLIDYGQATGADDY